VADNEQTVLSTTPQTGVAMVEINRPAARNALDVKTVAALGKSLYELDADPSVRAIVLAGVGGHLSAGSDIKEMNRLGLSCLRDPVRVEGWARIEAVRTPLIAAIDGLAVGAGLELALLADFIVAGPSARLGLPELRLGVMPGDGGSQRLAKVIGQSAAMRLVLTSQLVGADEAQSLGLAHLAQAGARDEAIRLAGLIASNAPVAARMAKMAIKAAGDTPLSVGLALEARSLELLFATQDCAEGLAAFVAKRPPVFQGR
jgi:enoyl-CoA hydratase